MPTHLPILPDPQHVARLLESAQLIASDPRNPEPVREAGSSLAHALAALAAGGALVERLAVALSEAMEQHPRHGPDPDAN